MVRLHVLLGNAFFYLPHSLGEGTQKTCWSWRSWELTLYYLSPPAVAIWPTAGVLSIFACLPLSTAICQLAICQLLGALPSSLYSGRDRVSRNCTPLLRCSPHTGATCPSRSFSTLLSHMRTAGARQVSSALHCGLHFQAPCHPSFYLFIVATF